MRPEALIFDLDGTLWDSTPSLANAWNLAIRKAQIDRSPITVQEVRETCGLVLEECLDVLLGDVSYNLEDFLYHLNACEREIFEQFGGDLYPYVSEGLEKLRYKYKLFIVSNCQDWYLSCFFKQTGLGACFIDVETHGSTGLSKAENLVSLIHRNQLSDSIYIGDTIWDKEAATEAQVPFYQAKYGFGDFFHDQSFSSFSDLVSFFIDEES